MELSSFPVTLNPKIELRAPRTETKIQSPKEAEKQMKKIRIILMMHILFLEIMYTKYLLQVYAFLKIRGHFIFLKTQTAQPR